MSDLTPYAAALLRVLSRQRASIGGMATVTALPSTRTIGSLDARDLGTKIHVLDAEGKRHHITLMSVLHDIRNGRRMTYLFDAHNDALILDSGSRIA